MTRRETGMTHRQFLIEVGGLVKLPKLATNGVDKSFAEIISALPRDFELLDSNCCVNGAGDILSMAFTWAAQGHWLGVSPDECAMYFFECAQLLDKSNYMYFCNGLTNGPTLKAAIDRPDAALEKPQKVLISIRVGDKVIEAYDAAHLYEQIEQMQLFGGRE